MTPKRAGRGRDLARRDRRQGLTPERDARVHATGWLTGNISASSALFDRLPKPTYDDNLRGTRQFFSELNRLGITGVIDPGGFNISPPQYAALFQLWRERALTVRVAYSLFAQNIGAELAELPQPDADAADGLSATTCCASTASASASPARCTTTTSPTPRPKEKFLEVIRWAARQRLALTIHWQEDASVAPLLDLFEQRAIARSPIARAALVDRPPRQRRRRHAGAHEGARHRLDDAGRDVLQRRSRRAASRRRGAPHAAASGPRCAWACASAPAPMRTASRRTTRSSRCSGCSTAGPSVACRRAAPTRRPSREQALRLYTAGSAWFSFDDDRRGTLEVGKLADFAILDQDYLAVPVERIGRTVSLLTVVGGKVVYAAAPFRWRNERHRTAGCLHRAWPCCAPAPAWRPPRRRTSCAN